MPQTIPQGQTKAKLTRNSTNVIKLDYLRDVENNVYPTSATVSFTLKDKFGNNVTGAVGISMPYVSASGPPPLYRGLLPYTVALPDNRYYGYITVIYGSIRREFVVNFDIIDG